jgi:putative transposase
MAVWRRKPKTKLHVHSDPGSQFTSYEWQKFLEHHSAPSMSPRTNCWDNAVVQSFFNLLKRGRIRRRTHNTSEDGRRDVFDYIECFYIPGALLYKSVDWRNAPSLGQTSSATFVTGMPSAM